jgi:hypothetical protein
MREVTDREELLIEALERIAQWADAYPLSVFPAPDDDYMKRAHEVLKAHGMTIDRISADAMRHVLYGVGRIARAALAGRREEESVAAPKITDHRFDSGSFGGGDQGECAICGRDALEHQS